MSESTSSPQNSTSTATSNTNTNYNSSGNSGLTLTGVDKSNLSVTTLTTDYGAVNSGIDAAKTALHANLDTSALAITTAADLAHQTSTIVADTSTHALDTVAGFAASTLQSFGKTLGDYQLAEQTQLGNVVSALNTTYAENTTNQVSQARDASQNTIRYTLLAAVAVVGLYVIGKKIA